MVARWVGLMGGCLSSVTCTDNAWLRDVGELAGLIENDQV